MIKQKKIKCNYENVYFEIHQKETANVIGKEKGP